jgi:hypothetical protein
MLATVHLCPIRPVDVLKVVDQLERVHGCVSLSTRQAHVKISMLLVSVAVGDASIEQHRHTLGQVLDQTEQWSTILDADEIERLFPSLMSDDGETHVLLFVADGEIEEGLVATVDEQVGRSRQKQIDTVDMPSSSRTMQRRHAESIGRVDEMGVCLQNGVDGGEMAMMTCEMQWCVAIVGFGELGAFVQQELDDACVAVVTGEMQRCLTRVIRLVENTLEAGRVEQLSTRVVATVPAIGRSLGSCKRRSYCAAKCNDDCRWLVFLLISAPCWIRMLSTLTWPSRDA